jgi:hypothetical protein
MDGLDIVGMIVPPRSSHSTRVDVELPLAESAHAILGGDLSVHQLSHFGVRADLPISAGVLRIVNAADAHLARLSFLRNGFSSAASH